jgi:LmbE family N-acetylglucosaminyl deacetylase
MIVLRRIWKVSRDWRRGQELLRLKREARDITDRVTTGSALILAPHPDDEVIGCGALIARKVDAGVPVDVVIITDGAATTLPADATRDEKAELRAAEARVALARLGVRADRLHFLGLEDGHLARQRTTLESRIQELLDHLAPAELYVSSRLDPHVDHQTAALTVEALVQRRGLPISVLEYPVWALTAPTTLRQHRLVAVNAGPYLDHKREAFAAYQSRAGFGPLIDQFFGDTELFLPMGQPTTNSDLF